MLAPTSAGFQPRTYVPPLAAQPVARRRQILRCPEIIFCKKEASLSRSFSVCLRRRTESSRRSNPRQRICTSAATPSDGEAKPEISAEDRYNLGGSKAKGLTLPTILTLGRIVLIPAIYYVYFLKTTWAAATCSAIFLVAAITDWLDGYLARKMNSTSAFGAFLDPVADKLMVAATLILLCTIQPVGPATTYPALVPLCATCIISREITMSALREWAAAAGGEAHKAVAVNSLGKWKTATQMAALTLMLFFKEGGKGLVPELGANLGVALLLASTILALWSLAVYMGPILKYMD
ncbi:hypothetical protein CYMTET_38910 [Cymbomonas tetramitiformis]|uniref:CDP-diacylglycerol--glycerol-3-phosphate 3-phosphatidyltransferase n=1 Tax=Cymbomonas tetramitiformis TaxID=36881 RepID=A0AAE0CCJ4_9CHLO|nr:hypothetical protein CYMTET_38910 [Cymbomonas tetramitiformis]